MNDKDMLYKCLECGKQEIVKAGDHRIDGRACDKCKGHLSPIGYVGIDLASGQDKTVWYTPGSKKRKNSRHGENG